MAYTFDQLVGFAQQGGFSAQVAPTMAAIAIAESSGNNVIQQGQPYKTRGWGLWQITPGNSESGIGSDQQLLDPVLNAKAAYAKYQTQGLRAWSTYNDGVYKKYLNGNPGASGTSAINPTTGSATATADPFAGVTQALSGIGDSLGAVGKFATTVNKLSLPQTWVRVMSGVFGAGLLFVGIAMLTREVKS